MKKILQSLSIAALLILSSFRLMAVSIRYTGSPFTYFTGTAIASLTPVTSGGTAPYTYSLSPISSSLPAGLFFDPGTGIISGTPTTATPTATYTIMVTDASNATNTTSIKIVVYAPTLNYTGVVTPFYAGTAITPMDPVVEGNPVGGYGVSPSLPAGLIIDPTSGIISGTPTGLAVAATYTVTATYTGGVTATRAIRLIVDGIAYTGSPFTYYTGSAIINLSPNQVGAPSSYTISSLSTLNAAGLSFNPATGVISGTPSATSTSTPYTITANFAGGSSTAQINIQVLQGPTISYSGTPFTFFNGTPVGTIAPTLTGAITPTSYAISPSLPAGLTFSTGTGAISGTPTVSSATASYTVTAKYTGGVTSTTSISVTVDGIAYTGSSFVYYVGTTISSLTPAVVGTVTTPNGYSISPGLPAGLNFDQNSGIISGYPTSASSLQSYTVTANFSGGSSGASMKILVYAPTLNYTGIVTPFYVGVPITAMDPVVTGNPVGGYQVSPSLPTGLNIDLTSGIISGTPTTQTAPATYTVTATYQGGITATRAMRLIVDGISYTGSPFTYYQGIAITNLTPSQIGSPPSYSIAPQATFAATGLSFNTTNGVISGTPSATSPLTVYTVTGNFATGASSTTISIQVLPIVFTWTGNGPDLNWNDAANWTSLTGTAPGATGVVSIPATSKLPTVNVASSCDSLVVTGNTTITLAANLTVSGGLNINGGNLAFAGANAASFGGLSSIGSTNTLTVGSSASVTFNNTTLTLANGNGTANTQAIVNNGILTLNSTALTEGTFLTINNTGTFNINNSSTVTLANAVTDFTTPAYNTAFLAGLANYSLINSGTVTANGGSTLAFGDVGTIYNTSVFQAGTSNSGCTLNMSGNGSAILNAAAGTFVLGSTSTINLTGSTFTNGATIIPGVTNLSNGVFGLLSDAFGSATVGQITGTGVFSGSYYVQRFIQSSAQAGTSEGGFRLLSCPVFGGTSASPTTNTLDLTWLNATSTINGTIYPGAATAGLGGTTGGFTLQNGNPTIFLFDETIVPVTTHTGFYNGKNVGLTGVQSSGVFYLNNQLTPSSNSTVQPVYAGNGYLLYYVGPSNNYSTTGAVASDVITYFGQLNQSTIPFYDWFNPSGQLSYTNGVTRAGYNMVGNPYACPIDLVKVATDNPSLGTVNFWELTDAGNFVAYTYNTSTGGMSDGTSVQYIASGQGFFVQANGAGESLTFNEDQKNTTNASLPTLFLAKRTPNLENITASTGFDRALIQGSSNKLASLHLMLKKDNLTFKTTGIYFNEGWSDALDKNDARDLDAVSPVVYLSSLTSDGTRVGINALSDYAKGKNVQLYVKATTSGAFNLSLMDIANIDTSAYNVYVVDLLKKDSIDIAKSKTYSFSMDPSDSSSFGANRLLLSIQRKPQPAYQLLSFNGAKQNAGISINWKTTNEGNYTNFGLQKLNEGNKFVTIDSLQGNGSGNYPYFDTNPVTGKNIYRLVQNKIDGTSAYSTALVIPYNMPTIGGMLNVYPNPAQDVITVNFDSLVLPQSSTYNVNIYSSMGALIMQKSVTATSLTQDVSSFKPGTYLVQILNVNGTPVANTKFIKQQ